MPPAKSSRGRQAQRRSSVGSRRTQSAATADARPAARQTRSRSTASLAMGTPPPECDILEHFDDAPEIQEMVGSSALMMPRRSWERNMERRVASSEKLLGEVHAMMLAMRPGSANAPAPAAAGSAAQLLAGAPPVSGPPVQLEQAVPVQRGPFGLNEDANAAPWPDVNRVAGNEHSILGSLPEDTRELVASCDSSSLPLDARIPDRLRAQIWAGEFVDLSLLLKSTHAQQEYSLSVGGDSDAPTFRVSTAKVRGSNLSLEQWIKAFHLYMSVYLMQPDNLPSARKMLKYMQVIQNLYDQGGDWRAYDEAFRSLRYLRGWAWDFMNWELWLQASQSSRRWANSKGAPFPNKGKARHPSTNPCFAFNRGELCNAGNCRYAHKCRHCGDNHPVVRCRQAQGKQSRSGNTGPSAGPASGSSANGPTVWPRK